MAKFEKRQQAIMLRKAGESIKHIAETLGLSKSTVSLWCRTIVLTQAQRRRLMYRMIQAGHKGRMLGALANRKKKEDELSAASTWADSKMTSIQSDGFFLAGIALYWAEGSKDQKGNISFVNSDPRMVTFMYRWFITYFSVNKEDFILRIAINEIHRHRISSVLDFWSHLLELPIASFRDTTFIRTKQRKIYENHDRYYGLLVMRIRKSSRIKYKMLSLIERMNMPA